MEKIEEAVPPTLQEPPYPSVVGQVQPNLNLAGVATSKTSLAGGNFADSTPPQNIAVPALQPGSDVFNMGIDPLTNYFDLNLANNNDNIPSPATLAKGPQPSGINLPTFGLQNYTVPANRTFDLVAPGIDYLPPFLPDPDIPDLVHPDPVRGTDIVAATSNPMAIDPMAPDLSAYDRPAGLYMPGPLMVDPLHPDLQNPTTKQEVEMDDRPGDLDERALTILHDDPTCQMTPGASYEELWMAQAGNNMRRERHLGMLGYGLEREEGGYQSRGEGERQGEYA